MHEILYELSLFIWVTLWSFTSGSFQVTKSMMTTRCDQACFNGVCSNGTCNCWLGWTGDQCQFCDGRIIMNPSNDGVLADGPLNYSSMSRCMWLIKSVDSESGPVRLRLDQFLTECGWDHLFVYDGDSVYGRQLAAFRCPPVHVVIVQVSGHFSGSYDDAIDTEVVAPSGSALVLFNSDLAYNMTGFNVSYSYRPCPNDCSGRGRCQLPDGMCHCDAGYTGQACQWKLCANCQNGADCDPVTGRCTCDGYFHGTHCEASRTKAVWQGVPSAMPGARASHASTVLNGSIWIVSGAHFSGIDSFPQLVRFDPYAEIWTTIRVVGEKPPSRYDHSVVNYNDKLYVFGGVLEHGNITNDLWSFDPMTGVWTLEWFSDDSDSTLPLSVAGHTAHVINDVMIIVFGYNIYQGFLHQIQEFDFATRIWTIPETSGVRVHGGFGHSSSTISKEKQVIIIVYGGYSASRHRATYAISDRLFEYNPNERRWREMTPSGQQLFRHSSSVVNGIFVIVGGNCYNESSPNRPTNCYSKRIIGFDTVCEEWFNLDTSSSLPLLRPPLDRFGHSSEAVDERIYVIGGFNGQMLDDVVKFVPGITHSVSSGQNSVDGGFCSSPADCAAFKRSEFAACLAANQGVKCDFDTDDHSMPCKQRRSSSGRTLMQVDKNDAVRAQYSCAKNTLSSSSSPSSSSSSSSTSSCSHWSSCSECTFHQCLWCSSDLSCRPTASHSCPESSTIADASSCPVHLHRPCSLLFECAACRQLSYCRWYSSVCIAVTQFGANLDHCRSAVMHFSFPFSTLGANIVAHDMLFSFALSRYTHISENLLQNALENTQLVKVDKLLIANTINSSCPVPCALLTDCTMCVNGRCMWCSSTRRCVSMNAYTMSFPYGQCSSWISSSNDVDRCRLDPLDCQSQRTCTECQQVGPRCGWCDDGSNTGTGRCLPGGLSGPVRKYSSQRYEVDSAICPSKRWFFVGCPACQCNGHSFCTSNRTKTNQLHCHKCQNNTFGANCERCKLGYFGDAFNGGLCSSCECNGQAVDCDRLTGHCYCTTKGVSGSHCDSCEQKYYGDPKNNQSCYYQLAMDFIFTFSVDETVPEDQHVNRINFFSRPHKEDWNVKFSIICKHGRALVNLSMYSDLFIGYPGRKRRFLANQICDAQGIERTFNANDPDFHFGSDVYLHGFHIPIKVIISFSQTKDIDWVLFFVIFAACFIVLLVLVGLMWMVKQRIDLYRRRQRMFVEIEQMASRPFGTIRLQLKSSQPKVQMSILQAPASPEPNKKQKRRLRRFWPFSL